LIPEIRDLSVCRRRRRHEESTAAEALNDAPPTARPADERRPRLTAARARLQRPPGIERVLQAVHLVR